MCKYQMHFLCERINPEKIKMPNFKSVLSSFLNIIIQLAFICFFFSCSSSCLLVHPSIMTRLSVWTAWKSAETVGLVVVFLICYPNWLENRASTIQYNLSNYSRRIQTQYIILFSWPLKGDFTHVANSHTDLLDERKCLHNKRVELAQDWFGTPTWPLFHCFGTPIWLLWHHVKIRHYHPLHSSVWDLCESVFKLFDDCSLI